MAEGGLLSVSVSKDLTELQKQLREKLQASKVNILVMGHAGSGKTTLIRLVLGVPVGESGVGMPVTQSFLKYQDVGKKLCIYDSKGMVFVMFVLVFLFEMCFKFVLMVFLLFVCSLFVQCI